MTDASAAQAFIPTEEDYQRVERALREAPRGEWFLEEFARRNRVADTQIILDRLDKFENESSEKAIDNQVVYLRNELEQMAASILKARQEIASIRPAEDGENRIMAATEELDAIVTSTERATGEILAAAERVQDDLEKLREAGAPSDICDEIDTQTIEIFTACSFQDLTGQRTTKVVNVLRYLETRINSIVSIWGDAKGETVEAAPEPEELIDVRPDSHLLNGPQADSVAISQDDIDALLNDAFDGNVETDTASGDTASDDAAGDAPGETADQDDIDALFDETDAA